MRPGALPRGERLAPGKRLQRYTELTRSSRLKSGGQLARTQFPKPAAKPKPARPSKPAKALRPKTAVSGPDPGFPPAVKSLIMAVTGGRCGAPGLGGIPCSGRIDPHHRVYVGMGGTSLAEAHWPANGYPLCRAHHDWVHAHPKLSRAAGLKVLRNTRPGPQPHLVPIRLPGMALFWLDRVTGERLWDAPDGYVPEVAA